MNPNSARKMLLNTDYPLDKITQTFQGNFTAISRISSFQPRLTTYSFPHFMGTWGLIKGVYSRNSGSTWLEFGVVDADTSGAIPNYQTVEVTAYCTTTSIFVIASSYLASDTVINYSIKLMSRE